jgi:hypothetical protein
MCVIFDDVEADQNSAHTHTHTQRPGAQRPSDNAPYGFRNRDLLLVKRLDVQLRLWVNTGTVNVSVAGADSTNLAYNLTPA